MPYLRVYSQAVPIEQKRVIAEKLIEITLRTFHLRAQERNRITIQFQAIPRGSDFTLEVIGHDLTEERRKAFAEEASAMLTRLVPVKPSSRIARLLGIKWAAPLRIVLEFDELSPAISDPFVVDLEPDWAA
jgi:phenylpyruvate tautomerase PptA (4-oxalocrotonate tautomerase family)